MSLRGVLRQSFDLAQDMAQDKLCDEAVLVSIKVVTLAPAQTAGAVQVLLRSLPHSLRSGSTSSLAMTINATLQ